MIDDLVATLQGNVRTYFAQAAVAKTDDAAAYEWLADVVTQAIPASWVPPAPGWLTHDDLEAAVDACLAQAQNFLPTDSLEHLELRALRQEIADIGGDDGDGRSVSSAG